MQRESVYRAFERFWHWMQAALIIMLGVTGFEIHGTLRFFGFRQAVAYHNAAAISFLVLIVFAIFWHFTTGEWKQYLPTREHLRAYVNYYVVGIFRGVPHPTKKHVLSKLNPLQKLVYAGLKALVIPVMGITGLLYMFYRYPQRYEVISLNVSSLKVIALVHILGAFTLVCFFIAHLYLITTGSSVTSNLKAMITGYEDLPDSSAETRHPEGASRLPTNHRG